ncbi:MAG TPA: YceI family protein [Ktedonobacteraceae bacterium]
MAWEIDPVHSDAHFSVRHAMVSNVRGQFKVLSGKLEIDEQQPENSSVEAQVETSSVDTRNEQRDGHLRSADFFDAEKYPVISFKSTKVESKGGENYRVLGLLSLHGIEKEVEFNAEYAGQGKDPWGGTRAGLTAVTTINRKDFGLTYNTALETGGVLVSDAVKVEINLSAVYKG